MAAATGLHVYKPLICLKGMLMARYKMNVKNVIEMIVAAAITFIILELLGVFYG